MATPEAPLKGEQTGIIPEEGLTSVGLLEAWVFPLQAGEGEVSFQGRLRPEPMRYHLFETDIQPSPLQQRAWDELESMWQGSCGGYQKITTIPSAREASHSPSSMPRVLVVFADDSDWDSEIDPHTTLGKMPKPRPEAILAINTVDRLPDGLDRKEARAQLVKKASHYQVVFEGGRNRTKFSRALWVSIAGNWKIIEGTEDQIMEEVFRRCINLLASPMLTHRHDSVAPFTWEAWARSAIPGIMKRSAEALGAAEIIKDRFDFTGYASPEQVRKIETVLDKRLAESQQASLPWVLKSGAGKVSFNPDPLVGDLVPITEIVLRPGEEGYYIGRPEDPLLPANFRYPEPSVEATLNGLTWIAGRLAQERRVGDFESFLRWMSRQALKEEAIPVLSPERIEKVRFFRHIHFQAEAAKPGQVHIVTPDRRYFPRQTDYGCGSLWEALMALSGFYQSSFFSEPGPEDDPLSGRIIWVNMPGHGSFIIGGDSDQIDNAIMHQVRLIQPLPV